MRLLTAFLSFCAVTFFSRPSLLKLKFFKKKKMEGDCYVRGRPVEGTPETESRGDTEGCRVPHSEDGSFMRTKNIKVALSKDAETKTVLTFCLYPSIDQFGLFLPLHSLPSLTQSLGFRYQHHYSCPRICSPAFSEPLGPKSQFSSAQFCHSVFSDRLSYSPVPLPPPFHLHIKPPESRLRQVLSLSSTFYIYLSLEYNHVQRLKTYASCLIFLTSR